MIEKYIGNERFLEKVVPKKLPVMYFKFFEITAYINYGPPTQFRFFGFRRSLRKYVIRKIICVRFKIDKLLKVILGHR